MCTNLVTILPPLAMTAAVSKEEVYGQDMVSKYRTGLSKVTCSLQGPESTIVNSSADTLYEPSSVGLFQPCKPYKPNPILNPDEVRQKAKTLLTMGCMPLLPPGRRDLSMMLEESIYLCQNMCWPPMGWHPLTRDQR